ncbi:MAG: response regulator [Ignavibacteria bacterium]|nr:response regulator [Ignavibacteria bacterium]
MKILIAEDDFTSRIFLQKLLNSFGSCDIVVNGEEAVQAFQIAMEEGIPYDLICLDIMMPEMDGKEALKIIREREKNLNIAPEKETRILMVTALDSPKDVIESYYYGGCTSYLVKPIQKSILVKRLRDLKLLPEI